MRIAVLGRLEVRTDDGAVEIRPRKQRALLAALALRAGRVVPLPELAALVWGEDAPEAADASLHGYVAALRRLLEPGRVARDGAGIIRTASPGYRLDVQTDAVDAVGLAITARRVHDRLADDPSDEDELRRLDAALAEALDAWRGTPFEDLADGPEVEAERTVLEEIRLTALMDRSAVLLRLGQPGRGAQVLAGAVRERPLREDLAIASATALAAAGRQADALEALRALRTALADELGVEPGAEAARLEVAILRQEVGPVPAGGATAAQPGAPEPSSLVGRAEELAALDRLADGRVARFALLTGEPGIGKTALAAEHAARARRRGVLAVTVRCSSDEGAPPLWPWVEALRELESAGALPPRGAEGLLDRAEEATAGVGRFRLFDEVRRSLRAAAERSPVLIVLDDLHWADASSLRLLQHLVEHPPAAPLVVLGTRRSHPEPAGALGELGATLARAGAVRIDLTGLPVDAVRALGRSVGRRLAPADARAIHDRTAGNPFFATELLRSAPSPAEDVPSAVGDVIAARVAQLPAPTRALLEAAAAIGRTVELPLLAHAAATDLAAALALLEPAVEAGVLVVESGTGAIRFRHALTRDAVEDRTPPLRRQLLHAALAEQLERARPGAVGEIAEHRLRAGTVDPGRAWRAARTAAEYAGALGAVEERAQLLGRAAAAQEADPSATDDDRYDLHLAWSAACRAAADGAGQRRAAREALRIATDAGDDERRAAAAIAASEGTLWSNRPEGEVDGATLEALTALAGRLPPGDSLLRCGVLLALSRELFWGPGHEEAAARAEQALGMARRLDAPDLVSASCAALIVAEYRPANLPDRVRLAEEAVSSARRSGDPEREAVGLLWRAVAAGEDGRVDDRATAVAEAQLLAARHRLRYLQVMLGGFEVPWLAMEGRFAEADALLDEITAWAATADFPFRDETLAAARLCLEVWRGGVAGLLEEYAALDEDSPTDMGGSVVLALLRAGRTRDAAAFVEARPFSLSADHFAATMDLAVAAEAALELQRPTLAAKAYPLLAPSAGRLASAGTGGPLGPVDAYLACAAAAVGERTLAARHADDALRLCTAWRLPAVADWLSAVRRRHRF